MAVQATGRIRIKRRAAGGASGAPSALLTSELAFNEVDGIFYIGYGDDGSGSATSVRAIGGAIHATHQDVADAVAGAGAGSVTSVGLSAPTGFSVTNSPVTGSGTITVSYATGYQAYTTAEANRLAGIADGANNYAHPTTDGNRHVPATPSGDINKFLRAAATAGQPAVWTALATVAVSGSYNDLSNRPTLGTLASKNAVTISEVTSLQGALDAKVAATALGAASGVATLDASGKLTAAQIPDAVLGAMRYQGTWNAATNSPAIPTASAANRGWYYIVATAGSSSVGGIAEWQIGDWLVSSGSKWDKVDNTDQVMSVAGRMGNVTLTHTDIGGLGSMATQAANAVNITGGSIDGIVLDGGTF